MGITIGYESYHQKPDKFLESDIVTSNTNNNVELDASIVHKLNISCVLDMDHNINEAIILATNIFNNYGIRVEVIPRQDETFYGVYFNFEGSHQWLTYGWNNYNYYDWENSQLIKTQNVKPFYIIHVCIIEILEAWLKHGLIDRIHDETRYYPGKNVELLVRSKTGIFERDSYIDNICYEYTDLKQHSKEFQLFYTVFNNQHPILTVDDFSLLSLDIARLNNNDMKNSYIVQSKGLDFLNTIYYALKNPLLNIFA